MGALLALVEDSGALVDGAGLHAVVLHLGVVAFGTALLDHHFGLAPAFAHRASLVLLQPLLVPPHLQVRAHDLACMRPSLPANSAKDRVLWHSWHWITSVIDSSSIRAPQTGQKSVWKESESIPIVVFGIGL